MILWLKYQAVQYFHFQSYYNLTADTAKFVTLEAVSLSKKDIIELSQSQSLRTIAVNDSDTELLAVETEPVAIAPVTGTPSFNIDIPTFPIAVGLTVAETVIK